MITKFIVKNKISSGFYEFRPVEYIVTIEKPAELEITIANAYQIFWNNFLKYGIDRKNIKCVEGETHFTEFPIDKIKLSKIKVP